jgi:hypothetical protein
MFLLYRGLRLDMQIWCNCCATTSICSADLLQQSVCVQNNPVFKWRKGLSGGHQLPAAVPTCLRRSVSVWRAACSRSILAL